jgi:hypothetical protein
MSDSTETNEAAFAATTWLYSVAVSTRDFDNSNLLESVSSTLSPHNQTPILTPLSGFEPQYDLISVNNFLHFCQALICFACRHNGQTLECKDGCFALPLKL